MGCSPRGSSVHGILQARVLEWIAMPSSWAASRPRDQIGSNPYHFHLLHWQACLLPLVPPWQIACWADTQRQMLFVTHLLIFYGVVSFMLLYICFFLFLPLCILLRKALPNLRSGEGNGTPLQYSCLENPMDGGAWCAAVHGVARSQTRLMRLNSSSSSNLRSEKLFICSFYFPLLLYNFAL